MELNQKFAYEEIKPPSLLLTPVGSLLSWALAFLGVWLALILLSNAMWMYGISLRESDFAANDHYWYSAIGYLAQTWFAAGIIVGVIAWIRWLESRPLETAGIGRTRNKDMAILYAAGLASVVVYVGMEHLVAMTRASNDVGDLARIAAGLQEVPPWSQGRNVIGFFVLFIALVSGVIAEEFLYRGWMLSALAPMFRVSGAILVSGVVFALTHIGPSELTSAAKLISFLDYNVVSATFAIIALRQGVWAATAFHMGINLTWLADDMIDGGGDARYAIAAWDQPRGTDDIGLACLSLALSLVILGWAWSRLPARLNRTDLGPAKQPAA